jgi:regulation of enolase protein 1 (concanavalin A-like superfamily)
VEGSGVGAVGNADNFNYLYQSLNGDGQIVAHVASQDNTDGSAQAGIMIRETLSPGSKHAAMLITPSTGILFERRLATGGATSVTVFSGVAAPYWLKLVRSGSTVTGFRSADGKSWTRLGSAASVPMATSVYVGLAVASNSNVAVSQANFDNLNLGPKANAGPDQTITLPATATLSRTTSDDGLPAGTLTYSWRKISGPGTVTFAGTSTSDTIATFSQAGVYVLRLTANDSKLAGTDDITITVNP